MDAKTFDRWTASLTRLLSEAGSRRRALALGLGSAAGLVYLEHVDETSAKRKHRRHKKKKKGQNSSPPPPPTDLCTNGVKDGNETDVDCGGGTCPRCRQLGQICNSRNDCYSDRCVGGTCQACASNILDCDPSCGCRLSDAGYKICTQANCTPHTGGTCALCGPGEQCALIVDGGTGTQIGIECCLPCGA
jgi:hypothetical protein